MGGTRRLGYMSALGKHRVGLRYLLLLACGIPVFAALVFLAVPRLRWRIRVLVLCASGRIPDIEFLQVVHYMLPQSEQWMEPLIETRNPYAVIHNFKTTAGDIQAG